jgi:TonB-dependent SusC/RagA subfamily outer membrane receptor
MNKLIAVTGLALCLALPASAQKTAFDTLVVRNNPICVIDGARHPSADCLGPSLNLPATKVKSVEILKGPAAMSSYGADAANGVIIVTTEAGPRASEQAGADPLARFLFPPELVMANQQAIGLTDRQRATMQEAIKDAQLKLVDLQFKLTQEVEKLQRLIQGASVDQAKALEQVDRLLTFEREVKHAQITLMIRIKNTLTEQQQAALGKLRG